jgi:titin
MTITNYQYAVSSNGGSTYSAYAALSPADGVSPITVTGLTQNTAYLIKLKAVNDVGVSDVESSPVSFTSEGVPTSAPSSLSSTQTNTTATISFTAAASSTSITNYEYSFNNSSWTALSPADAATPVTITGLTQNTAYTIYLRGVNSYGSGPGSTGLSLTTQGVPTSAPSSLSSVQTNNSVAISFTAAASSTALTNYEYSFNNSSWTALSPADAVSPVTISGLSQNTAYNVYLRGVNSYGSGPASSGLSFTTEGVPTGAATISLVTTTTTTATVTFSIAAGGGTITGYELYVANQTNAWNNTTASPISVTGLTANTTYGFFVRAKNAYGVGPDSAQYIIATQQNAASSVDYLVVAGGGAGGKDYGGGGGAGGYRTASGFAVTGGTSYTVTIGGGGAPNGGSGTNSVFSSITSTGGGGGGNFVDYQTPTAGNTGGSGGGGVGGYPSITSLGGSGTAGQGNGGGNGAAWASLRYTSGGGGGAGAAGGNAVSGSNAGSGGAGLQSSITGTATFYAGGGAGGWLAEYSTNIGSRSIGGSGIGGGWNGSAVVGPSGVVNTGSGGASFGQNTGDGFNTGGIGSGGSGVVVIAYPDSLRPLQSIGAGLTYTQPTRSGYRVYRFTGGTGTITF